MNITYFLTGSCNDIDNDFELTINKLLAVKERQSSEACEVELTDISTESKIIWQDSQPSFLLCLKDLDTFISGNAIMFYGKIHTSSDFDNEVDRELEDFILKRLQQ